LAISRSSSGSFSIKIWIVSSMSVDLYELLLHLVRIRELYNLLKIKYVVLPNYPINNIRYQRRG
jgi:hypothetical protein